MSAPDCSLAYRGSTKRGEGIYIYSHHQSNVVAFTGCTFGASRPWAPDTNCAVLGAVTIVLGTVKVVWERAIVAERTTLRQ